MSMCLITEYKSSADAKVGLEVLETGHFTLEQVSIVSNASDPAARHLRGLHEEGESSERGHTASAPEGRSTTLGMLIGGTVAAPIAAGTLIGPLIIAGPLVGMVIGAMVGSLLGGMERWGVGHNVSADFEARVEGGSVLLIVHDVDDVRLADAKALLKTTDHKSLQQYEAA